MISPRGLAAENFFEENFGALDDFEFLFFHFVEDVEFFSSLIF